MWTIIAWICMTLSIPCYCLSLYSLANFFGFRDQHDPIGFGLPLRIAAFIIFAVSGALGVALDVIAYQIMN